MRMGAESRAQAWLRGPGAALHHASHSLEPSRGVPGVPSVMRAAVLLTGCRDPAVTCIALPWVWWLALSSQLQPRHCTHTRGTHSISHQQRLQQQCLEDVTGVQWGQKHGQALCCACSAGAVGLCCAELEGAAAHVKVNCSLHGCSPHSAELSLQCSQQ